MDHTPLVAQNLAMPMWEALPPGIVGDVGDVARPTPPEPLTFPLPGKAISGPQLSDEIAGQLGTAVSVFVADGKLNVAGAEETRRSDVERVIAAHRPPARTEAPSAEDRLAALERRVAALEERA